VSAEPQAVPGLDLQNAVSVKAKDGSATAGTLSDVSGPQLLPAAFLDGLGTPPATDDRVKLGDVEAIRYRDLRPNGVERPLTLYVVPLETGAAAVACAAPGTACDQTAASLKLTGHEALPVGPSAAFAEDVDAVAADLESARAAADKALDRARTRSAQGDALAKLAAAYREAARTELAAGPAERSLASTLTARIEAAADAYGEAAQAARRGRESAYATARGTARKAESALASAFARLEDAGYRVG
jgi:hypothetical protein